MVEHDQHHRDGAQALDLGPHRGRCCATAGVARVAVRRGGSLWPSAWPLLAHVSSRTRAVTSGASRGSGHPRLSPARPASLRPTRTRGTPASLAPTGGAAPRRRTAAAGSRRSSRAAAPGPSVRSCATSQPIRPLLRRHRGLLEGHRLVVPELAHALDEHLPVPGAGTRVPPGSTPTCRWAAPRRGTPASPRRRRRSRTRARLVRLVSSRSRRSVDLVALLGDRRAVLTHAPPVDGLGEHVERAGRQEGPGQRRLVLVARALWEGEASARSQNYGRNSLFQANTSASSSGDLATSVAA